MSVLIEVPTAISTRTGQSCSCKLHFISCFLKTLANKKYMVGGGGLAVSKSYKTLNPKITSIGIHEKSFKSLKHSKEKYRFSLHSMLHTQSTQVILTVVLAIKLHSKVKFDSYEVMVCLIY